MSSNLIKYGYNYIPVDDTRVIDNNQLVKSRIETKQKAIFLAKSAEGVEEGEDGFVGGILATEIEVNEEAEITEEVIEEVIEEEPGVEELIEEARLEIEKMKKVAVDDLEQERKRVLADAEKTGYDIGKKKAMVEFSEQQQQLVEKEKALEEVFQKRIKEVEPKLIKMFNGIYQHLFTVDLAKSQPIICHLIRNAFTKIDGGTHYIVHVSEVDYNMVMKNKDVITSKAGDAVVVEFVEDSLLKKSECMIETENGVFDCGLGTQLEELKRKIEILSYEG